MKEKIIKFSDLNDARNFISRADQCDFDIDIMCRHIQLDGKSMMAVLSLDFNNPVKVKYNGENPGFEELLHQLAVNE